MCLGDGLLRHTSRIARVVLTCTLALVLLSAATRQTALQEGPLQPEAHRGPDLASLQATRLVAGGDFPWYSITRVPPADWVPTAPPPGIDLDVTAISRTPRYASYCVRYDAGVPSLCPGTELDRRWPDPGEVVTFTAHVVNKGTQPSPSTTYTWAIDGTPTLTGTLPAVAARAEITATLLWSWDHALDGERLLGSHTIRFTVDPDDRVAETYESNNAVEDRTDALSLHLSMTPEAARAYDTPWDPRFPFSAEDWLQRQVAAMNAALAPAHDGTSAGVRIDRIDVVPETPLRDPGDDGAWFLTTDYRLHTSAYDPATDISWSFIHELGHQIGLIDLYNLDIPATAVQVTDAAGEPVNLGFQWPRPGVMGGGDAGAASDGPLFSSHDILGVLSDAGYRRGYFGEYQYDIPHETALRILDNTGAPADGVDVALFQRARADVPAIDATPEITGTTGVDGRLVLPNRPVGKGVTTATGHALRDNPFGPIDVLGRANGFLVRIRKGVHEEFHWLDVTDFNLAYWAGDVDEHTFTLRSHVPPADAPPGPVISSVRVQGDEATLCWQPTSTLPDDAIATHRVYRITSQDQAYEPVGDEVLGSCFSDLYSQGDRTLVVTAVDGLGRESAFSSPVWVPQLAGPDDVAVLSGGERIVLDARNDTDLLRQSEGGIYRQPIGNPHDHLDDSRFISADLGDRLLVSHPGDAYSDRQSVRVLDAGGDLILEFGRQGTAPGQLDDPAGVVASGRPCEVQAPLEPDAHTLLLASFDAPDTGSGRIGDPALCLCAAGESVADSAESESQTEHRCASCVSPAAVTFLPGRYGLGAAIGAGSALTVAMPSVETLPQGAIEFWIRPQWDGGDGRDHVFFALASGWFNRIRIAKGRDNRLSFTMWDGRRSSVVAYDVSEWRAGEWHHVAVTWEPGQAVLYLDGRQRGWTGAPAIPEVVPDTIYVGTSRWLEQPADAAIDELRVSDIPRVGNSDTCPYRILVVDSGNDRVQVFDALGHFVSAFGGRGDAPGLFDAPQDIILDGLGRVIVADTGNNRLQVLGFDGDALSFRQTISGFASPVGLAAFSETRFLVADTGHHNVKVLNAAGRVVAAFSLPRDGYRGFLSEPSGVAVDGAGDIIVADRADRRVITIPGVLAIPDNRLPLILRR